MKVSVNWLKQYTDINISVEKLVDKIGAQLGAVEEVIDLGARYKGIVVAKVMESKKHPNADKLSVCLIDDGKKTKAVKRHKKGLIQVVCGAPNVAVGQLVAYLPPGATVPSTFDKDPLVLEAREIRGVFSHGMIGSAKELAIADEHQGILVIDELAKPGDDFAKVYELDDYIIDIENKMFTHRPDCFGVLGVAREVSGILGKPFKSPEWYQEIPRFKSSRSTLPIKVVNTEPKLAPRFSVITMSDIKVAPSPIKLQSYLSRIGIRPINNVVDATNFVMWLTGQPLHAYDYDKLKTATLGVRLAKVGEKLAILGRKTLDLQKDNLVITDGKRPIALAGVIGGADTEVDQTTQNIVIESANFDMSAVRTSAMIYGLFTDAATRFTKNQSPRQGLAALAKAVAKLQKRAGGKVASKIVDDQRTLKKRPAAIQVAPDFVNQRLGLDLGSQKIGRLLQNVEFKVAKSGSRLVIAPPFWRTDIEVPEDVVEEVGRLYGYDHLPLNLPKRSLQPANPDALLSFKDHLRQQLARAGLNEVLTYSFVHGSLIEKAGQDIAQAFHIRNALSPDLQYYRQSLAPSLLKKLHANIKLGFERFGLFELGRAHLKGVNDEEKLPAELERLSLVLASQTKLPGASYYWAKQVTDYLLKALNIIGVTYQPLAQAHLLEPWLSASQPFAVEHSAVMMLDESILGIIGEPKAQLRQSLKLPSYVALAELDVMVLGALSQSTIYQPLNRFPELSQDLCLRVDQALAYAQLTALLDKLLADQADQKGYRWQLLPLDIFQKSAADKHKQITWRINLMHPERTLTTVEANKLLDYLADQAKKQFKAQRI